MPQSKIVLIFIVVIGLTAGYFYYSNIVGPPEAPAPLPINEASDDLETFSDLKLDFTILDNPIYQSLEQYGDAPVSSTVTGKKNIFLPF